MGTRLFNNTGNPHRTPLNCHEVERMNPLITALIVVLSLNAFMWMSQSAITEMNPAVTFYTGEGGILENHALGNGTDPYSELPTTGGAVSTESGNIFIDTFGTFMNWIAQKSGFDTVIQTLKAPYNLMKTIGVPEDLANIIGTMWYLVTILLVVLVATGRN